MAEVVSCPACHARVSLAAARAGRAVQCPSCKLSFLPDTPAQETVPLRLELPRTDPDFEAAPGVDAELLPPEQQPRAPRAPRPLVGAVEVPVPVGEQPEPRPLPPERFCRACGHLDESWGDRCLHCGAPLPPRAGRRPWEPSRGRQLRRLAIAGLALLVFPPLGLVFSVTAWVLSHGDLALMERRQMDPAGYRATRTGWVCGLIGTALNLLVGLIGLVWLVLYLRS